jgi:hypothetical protein
MTHGHLRPPAISTTLTDMTAARLLALRSFLLSLSAIIRSCYKSATAMTIRGIKWV